MRVKWPLLKLVRKAALGCVLTAAGGILCMVFEVVLSSGLAGTAWHRALVAGLTTVAPVVPGMVLAVMAPRRIKRGLAAKRWSADEIQSAFDWLESNRVKRTAHWCAGAAWVIFVSWILFYGDGSVWGVHLYPQLTTATFVIVPLSWFWALGPMLRAELPSEHTFVRSAKPLHSEHWGRHEA